MNGNSTFGIVAPDLDAYRAQIGRPLMIDTIAAQRTQIEADIAATKARVEAQRMDDARRAAKRANRPQRDAARRQRQLERAAAQPRGK